MEEYRSKIESLESEKNRLQSAKFEQAVISIMKRDLNLFNCRTKIT